jgi:hypothetical protein
VRVLLAVLTAGSVVPAFAQEEAVPPISDGPPVQYEHFSEVDVTGEYVKPRGVLVDMRQQGVFPPFIELRDNFTDRMLDDLRAVR